MPPEVSTTIRETMIAPGWYTVSCGDHCVRLWHRGRGWDVTAVGPKGETVAGPVRVSTIRRARIIARKWIGLQPTNGIDGEG